VVAHARSVAVRMLADRTGLTKELSKATARDVAVMLADGGECERRYQPVAPPRPGAGAAGLGADGVARVGRADSHCAEADREGPGQGPPTRVVPAA